MCSIGDHPHILGLIGIILEYYDLDAGVGSGPLIITPMMPNGDLLSYVSNPENTVIVKKVLDWAFQIADGNLSKLIINYLLTIVIYGHLFNSLQEWPIWRLKVLSTAIWPQGIASSTPRMRSRLQILAYLDRL